jgi:hypothetical protein
MLLALNRTPVRTLPLFMPAAKTVHLASVADLGL